MRKIENKEKVMMGIKILSTDEYWDEVYYIWRRVPVHWIGSRTSEIEHHIYRDGRN
jgi:hypothetical protein